jgi:hypothetical protein
MQKLEPIDLQIKKFANLISNLERWTIVALKTFELAWNA